MNYLAPILISSFLLVYSFNKAIAQGLLISPMYEMTVVGGQFGGSVAYQFNSNWMLGGFYQSGVELSNDGIITNNGFMGVGFAAPLIKNESACLLLNLRAGLVNENFIVLVPGFETQWMFNKNFGVATGGSLRYRHPSVMMKFIYRLF